ncbi:sortase [Yinghuangia sp. YIM S10712]|uniref:sortase n=1 Tax=Yinghuangia sp. YIM S10712 TaxID=3436930 RepID=UPI003F53BC87
MTTLDPVSGAADPVKTAAPATLPPITATATAVAVAPTEHKSEPGTEPKEVSGGGKGPTRAPGFRPAWDPFTIAGVALGLVVALLGGFVLYLATVSDFQQARTQRRLFDRISEDFYNAVGPLGGDIKEGTPIAILDIPSIDLRQVVVEGTTADQLRAGPGHLRNTSLPGGFGNSVLMGKRWSYGAPFGDIDRLKAGQKIQVTTQQGQFTYVVRDEMHVDKGDDDVIAPGGGHRLTLVTADSWVRPDGRTVVVADLQGQFEVAEPGRTRTVGDEEKGTSGEAGAGMALLLWAQAFALVCGVMAWALRRYNRRITLTLGAPTTIAVLWALYDNASRLLPATL